MTTRQKTGPFTKKKRTDSQVLNDTNKKSKELANLVVSVATALKQETQHQQTELRSATDQAFELTMKRFDVLEDQNTKQIVIMEKHIDDDKGIHDLVKTHVLYWKLILAPLGVILTGLVAWLIHLLLP